MRKRVRKRGNSKNKTGPLKTLRNMRVLESQAILLGFFLYVAVVLIASLAVSFCATRAFSEETANAASRVTTLLADGSSSTIGEKDADFASPFQPHEFRALWVLRNTLVSREGIDRMLRQADRAGFNVLFVQVRGRGDAFYASSLEPRAEALTDETFDPLAYLVSEAHKRRFGVHVWLNTFLVWSAPWQPTNPSHVMLSHPDWVAVLSDGRSLANLSRSEIEAMGIEGVFLAPGNPDVREHIRAVVKES